MKFGSRVYHTGDTRTITYFAWLPVCIVKKNFKFEDGSEFEECRWLERVTVKQERQTYDSGWVDMEFID